MPNTITSNKLAKELCVEVNSQPNELPTRVTDRFATERKMVCTRVLLPTDPDKRRIGRPTKILQVWLDAHYFFLYFYPETKEWKTVGK